MRHIIFVIVFLTSFAAPSVAQRIDQAYFNALTHKIQLQTSDTGRISASLELAKFYNNRFIIDEDKNNLKKAINLLDKSIDIAKSINNDHFKFEGIKLLANIYLAMDDTTKALNNITQVARYFETGHNWDDLIFTYARFAKTAYRTNYYTISINYYQRAIGISEHHNTNYPILPVKASLILARANYGQAALAKKETSDILAKYSSKNENLAVIYFFLASEYRYKGDLKKALTYALASARDVELYRDTINSNNAYGELAQVYDALGKTEQSIIYYKKTLAARDKMLTQEIYRFRTLGFIVKGLIKLGRASEALKEALIYEREHPPVTDEGTAYSAQNKAYCYEALHDYPKAEEFYKKMISILGENDQSEIASLAYYDVGKFYLKTGKYAEAQKYASKLPAVSALENYKNFEQLKLEIDSALGNYRSALVHFSNYQRAKDSLFNESKSKEISELQVKYETAQKENDIALLKKDAQLQGNQLKQSEHIRNITLGGIFLLLAVVALLYSSYRINIKKTREIDEKNISLGNLVEEKEWLMKEIHHRVKNNLQIVMGLLQRQSAYINNSAALKAIRNSEHRIHAIALIHQKLYQSDDLALINMQEYIDELLSHLKETTDIGNKIRFNKEVDEIYLHVAQAVPLGLIINEAVTNSIKYAYPNDVDGIIRTAFLAVANDQYSLVIEDDGVGIVEYVNDKSMGMSLMRGLSKQLGGKFQMSHGNGVSICITFKVNLSDTNFDHAANNQ